MHDVGVDAVESETQTSRASGESRIELEKSRRTATSDDFLVPGPTPESNEGWARWGISWIVFSLVLMVFMALLSFVCLLLANVTGLG